MSDWPDLSGMARDVRWEQENQRKFLWLWYVKELHNVELCTCSYCDIARTRWLRFYIMRPAFKYWLAGWWSLCIIRGKRASYRRVTLTIHGWRKR